MNQVVKRIDPPALEHRGHGNRTGRHGHHVDKHEASRHIGLKCPVAGAVCRFNRVVFAGVALRCDMTNPTIEHLSLHPRIGGLRLRVCSRNGDWR